MARNAKALHEIPFDKIYVGMPVVSTDGNIKGEVAFAKKTKAVPIVLIEIEDGHFDWSYQEDRSLWNVDSKRL